MQYNGLEVPANANLEYYVLSSMQRNSLYSSAMRYYQVPGRHYHDEEHIHQMLSHHSKVFGCAPTDALFVAIIMHDAIYIPSFSPESEEMSMKLIPSLYHRVIGDKIPMSLCDRSFELIRYTLPSVHVRDLRDIIKSEGDVAKLLDLDLSSMSVDNWQTFVNNQAHIDLEFSHLADRAHRRHAAADFLENFISKGFVYYTPEFQSRNAQALQNLKAYVQAVRVHKEYDWGFLAARDPVQLAAEYSS